MTLRGLIIGIAVCFSATIFVSSGWSQSHPNRKRTTSYSYDTYTSFFPDTYGTYDYSTPVDYSQEIKKSVELLKSETERLAIGQILADLATKSSSEIFGLKLATDVCQEIACRGASPDAAHRYVAAYADKRAADDAHQTALRNAAAAEWSVVIAAAAASVSLLSLLISGLSFWRTLRNTKSAIPA
ncbi:MAG: hypothetical protein M3178_03080 [Pseudomonadota bacterium]|nr:hypothetical protein [Pseudomonadota bacterium]